MEYILKQILGSNFRWSTLTILMHRIHSSWLALVYLETNIKLGQIFDDQLLPYWCTVFVVNDCSFLWLKHLMQLFIELLMQFLSVSVWFCSWWGDDTTWILQFPKARRDILVYACMKSTWLCIYLCWHLLWIPFAFLFPALFIITLL